MAALLITLAMACSSQDPDRARTTVEDRQRGCSYAVPTGWLSLDGEARSREGTLFTIHVYELEGAERGFVEGLPDTIFPKIEEWARHFFIVDGKPQRSETSVGGQPAVLLTYATRVRQQDPPSTLLYWITRKGSRLFVLRTAYAPGARAKDERDVNGIVESFKFLG